MSVMKWFTLHQLDRLEESDAAMWAEINASRAREASRMAEYERRIAEQRARHRRDFPVWEDLTTRWACPVDDCYRQALMYRAPLCPDHHIPML